MHYRKIWENYHGKKIPEGYEIHHIDGNRNNNNIDNLLCVSIEGHLQIHLDQEDWSAVQSIFLRIKNDLNFKNENFKEICSKAQKKLWEEGNHNWQINSEKRKINFDLHMKTRIEKTGNAFLGINDRVDNGRKAGKIAAEKNAGFLNINSNFHGSKAVKNTKWWTNIDGTRVRSHECPPGDWKQGMKYDK